MSMRHRLSTQLAAKPYVISVVLVLLLFAWMASGQLSQPDQTQPMLTDWSTGSLPSVRTKAFKAELVTRSVHLYGRTEPDRTATVAAEVSGQVIEVIARRGSVLKEGDLIARIETNNLPEQIAYAKARFKQREVEFDGIQKLNANGFQGKVRLAEAVASLSQAQADLAALNRMLSKTEIRASQSGILNERYIEAGDFVSVGAAVAEITDINPLVVRADVTEKDVHAIHLGQKAVVSLRNAQQVEGELRYISRVSNKETNTFKVEVSIPNADLKLWAGESAELTLSLEETRAIKLPPSYLALDDAGQVGVKTVTDGVVGFHPVDLVKTDVDGAWLGGFDAAAEIIILGQGFVNVGDRVSTTRVGN
ncbi:efflux RND transporter periplasmic adaptor subunit [Photobacterium sp. TY1-4]|uniref:efflux RND transporter periplasmic adaptor subunit n=1 Tax=Photobacterium sp. TY1-4 TaxID=2899122 RepID=UPI0021BE888C|nr:efflux RND transporter periplasmic adaptor subunit [Photobacterium sp. TY1-4]UXI02177.1 efflux RND transporter periplasmic adaptor subunit [Photobacterium sp. TY1-4]